LKTFSNPEFYLWFLLPTAIALAIIIRSTFISVRRKTIASWVFTFIVIILISLSEVILYKIFFKESYPTFIPHIFIAFSLLLIVIQSSIKRKTG